MVTATDNLAAQHFIFNVICLFSFDAPLPFTPTLFQPTLLQPSESLTELSDILPQSYLYSEGMTCAATKIHSRHRNSLDPVQRTLKFGFDSFMMAYAGELKGDKLISSWKEFRKMKYTAMCGVKGGIPILERGFE